MRRKQPARLDTIIAAATAAFINPGFVRAKIHQIADAAKVGPGTVYLYVADKDALFELALLRALESPLVAHPALPYPKTAPERLSQLIENCLREVSHFPQLWVAAQHRKLGPADQEYFGILLEIIGWLHRYRNAILLAERNRLDWPNLADAFQRVIWSDVHKRLTTYLSTRIRAGHLAAAGDPALIARFTLDSLVACQATGPLEQPLLPTDQDELLARLIGGALLPSRGRLPDPTHPSEKPPV